MNRVPLRDVANASGRSMRRLQHLCQDGAVISARKDQPRHGWSVLECCAESLKQGERLCATCLDSESEHARAETA